jgi:hypothetical protein
MYYKITSTEKHFLLFLNKKNGCKFKKSFNHKDDAEEYVKNYLNYCCSACKSDGFVYKTRIMSDMRVSEGNSRVIEYRKCPECRAVNRLVYTFAHAFAYQRPNKNVNRS